MFRRYLLLAVCCAAGLVGQLGLVSGANAAGVDLAHSRVGIVFKVMATPIEASFLRFSATIDYNATQPETTKATVTIDSASLDLGEPDYNRAVTQPVWLDAGRFPSATFVASSIKSSAANKLMVSGRLTIKGKALDLDFPVTTKIENGTRVFVGRIPIRRQAFNLGEGEWRDTGVVADEVVIVFRLVQAR